MQVEPGGGADHRVLLVTETLKGFPALLQIALPLLFVEGVRRFLLCASEGGSSSRAATVLSARR